MVCDIILYDGCHGRSTLWLRHWNIRWSNINGAISKEILSKCVCEYEDTKISNYCKFNSELLTSFTSSLYVSGLVASFFASPITKLHGLKPSILIGGLAFLAGSAIGGAALNIYMLILGRLLLGVGVGFANQSVPLYLSEMAPPKYRGAFNNSFQLSIGIGALTANLINVVTEKIEGGRGWRVSLAMAVVPASILILGAFLLPETPNSLIQRSKKYRATTTTNDLVHKAKLTLQSVRGKSDVEAELDDLYKQVARFPKQSRAIRSTKYYNANTGLNS